MTLALAVTVGLRSIVDTSSGVYSQAQALFLHPRCGMFDVPAKARRALARPARSMTPRACPYDPGVAARHIPLAARLDGADVCVCVGPGGVGKTTISAAIGLGLAARGKKVVVVSIDPAK